MQADANRPLLSKVSALQASLLRRAKSQSPGFAIETVSSLILLHVPVDSPSLKI